MPAARAGEREGVDALAQAGIALAQSQGQNARTQPHDLVALRQEERIESRSGPSMLFFFSS